jgi:hypothetical protein
MTFIAGMLSPILIVMDVSLLVGMIYPPIRHLSPGEARLVLARNSPHG